MPGLAPVPPAGGGTPRGPRPPGEGASVPAGGGVRTSPGLAPGLAPAPAPAYCLLLGPPAVAVAFVQ